MHHWFLQLSLFYNPLPTYHLCSTFPLLLGLIFTPSTHFHFLSSLLFALSSFPPHPDLSTLFAPFPLLHLLLFQHHPPSPLFILSHISSLLKWMSNLVPILIPSLGCHLNGRVGTHIHLHLLSMQIAAFDFAQLISHTEKGTSCTQKQRIFL